MHAMIDLETLNVGVSAPLFEIGITLFNIKDLTIAGSMQFNVDLLDVILTTGFCPNPETIKWWQAQSYDPRSLLRNGLKDTLLQLSQLMIGNSVDMVWGNSPSFDCVLLQRHYEACDLPVPWTYKQELDFRTVRWLRKLQGWEPKTERGPVMHNAMQDSIDQTHALFDMLGEGET